MSKNLPAISEPGWLVAPVVLEYDSNNSGGSFWLDDEHWFALAEAGWEIAWAMGSGLDYDRLPPPKNASARDRRRWLGTLATKARITTFNPLQSIREWEKITESDASAEGCNCCGPPHTFSWGEGNDWQCLSASEVGAALPGVTGLSVRALQEIIAEFVKQHQEQQEQIIEAEVIEIEDA